MICLAVTAGLTFLCLGHLDGLGIGTVIAAFTTGKAVGIVGDFLDKQVRFLSILTQRRIHRIKNAGGKRE